MPKRTISVSKVARHLADCGQRTHSEDTAFVLFRNGVPVAPLVPYKEKSCSGLELVNVTSKVGSSKAESAGSIQDLKIARNTLTAQRTRRRKAKEYADTRNGVPVVPSRGEVVTLEHIEGLIDSELL